MIEKAEVREFVRRKRVEERPFLQCLSRAVPEDAADLMLKMLTFNPAKRISAAVEEGMMMMKCRRRCSIRSSRVYGMRSCRMRARNGLMRSGKRGRR